MSASAQGSSLKALWKRFAAPFSRRDLVEAALVGVAFVLYFLVRGAVIDRPATAYFHALDVIDLQRQLGFFWEDSMNEWTADHLFWAQAANIVYFWLHFPLIIAFGIWLYYFRRGKYTLMRDAFLASGALALIIYWSYPVAPPRVLPDLASRFDPNAPDYVLGFIDTVQKYLGYAYDTQSTRTFVNPYAAMPSLHFGWDLLLGIGIVRAFWRERWMRIAVSIGISLPILQVFSIIMTANHYFLDAAAGAVVALLGFPVALALQRWGYPTLGRALARLPLPALRRFITGDKEAPGETPAGLSPGS